MEPGDRGFYWYGVSGQSITPTIRGYISEYVDVSAGTYKFKTADAEGDGDMHNFLCFANMHECLEVMIQICKVCDPDGFRGGASIALQGLTTRTPRYVKY